MFLTQSCREDAMADVTYHVVLPFRTDEDGELTAGEAVEAPSAGSAVMRAERLALAQQDGVCGAVAFSRTGDPATGEFEDAVILKQFGSVPADLLAAVSG
jgi:hypothetical protein